MREPEPIGLQLGRTARAVGAEFARAMADAGGSASTWQVLLLVRSQQWGNQAGIARAMGITGATLTHHLGALERDGIVRRWREEGNRREQRVELTEEGVALFERLRAAARAYDRRLRAALEPGEAEQLGALLAKLREHAGP
jgi:MarR family transcriptional regulator for hemolysin